MKTEPISQIDNFWRNLDGPTNLMIITAVFEFGQPIDYARLQATIENRWLVFDRFKKRIKKTAFGGFRWEIDPEFHIRSHLHRVALPGKGGREELQDMIADLTAMPLDPSKPLWQVHLIENYNGGCALFWRIHHCIADGISLANVLLSTADKTADGELEVKKTPEERDVIKREKSGGKLFGGVFNSLSFKPLKTAAADLSDIGLVLCKQIISEPKTVLKGRVGVRKSVAWSEPLSLDAAKSVGRVFGGTLNDVLVSAVTGALRRYLMERNTPMSGLNLRVSMPVNIRPRGTELELGNRFGLVSLSLPVFIEDPILRLNEVKRRNDRIKGSTEASASFRILKAMGRAPANIAKKTADFFADKGTAVLSNVPGPSTPLYFAGRKIKNIMFWVPCTGHTGMGISIISYAGKIILGLATDESLIADPDVIPRFFKAEMEDMIKRARIIDESADNAGVAWEHSPGVDFEGSGAAGIPETQYLSIIDKACKKCDISFHDANVKNGDIRISA